MSGRKYESDPDWLGITFGPSETVRRELAKQGAENAMDNLSTEITQKQDLRNAFKGKYGDNLAETGMAFAQIGRPENYGNVYYKGHYIPAAEIYEPFGQALADAISAQDEASRGEWTANFFRDLRRTTRTNQG